MGKPAVNSLIQFKSAFDNLSQEAGKNQFLTYYFIAAYPGCSDREMKKLHDYASQTLHLNPEQVQVFTPTPSTYASVMYYTEKDPFTGQPIFVEKNLARKQKQKEIITPKTNLPVRHAAMNTTHSQIKRDPHGRK